MYCRKCGSPVPEGQAFCSRCGEPVSGPAAAQPPQAPYPPQGSVPWPGRKKKPAKVRGHHGCLITFLVFLGLFIALIVWGVTRVFPTPAGRQEAQREPAVLVQKEASTPLRASLGGSYAPDEADFRFDGAVSGYVDHVVLVFFQKGVSDEEVRRVAALADAEILGCIDSLDGFQFRVPASGRDQLEALCEKLTREESVFLAVMDHLTRDEVQWSDYGLDDVIPDDPWPVERIPAFLQWITRPFVQQWSMIWPRGENWHEEIIGAPSAWAYEEFYSPVKVGIVDSGFDTDHPDLTITVVNPEANAATMTQAEATPGPAASATPAADTGREIKEGIDHGTHVAGIIGAGRGNGTGISGILCGDYSLYGFCETNAVYTNTNHLLEAYSSLLDQGCRVISRSKGYSWEGKYDNGVDRLSGDRRPLNDTGDEYTDEDWEEEGTIGAETVLILLNAYEDRFLLVNSAGNDGIDSIYNGRLCSITESSAEAAVRKTGTRIWSAENVLDSVIVVASVRFSGTYGDYDLKPGNTTRDLELTLAASSNYGPAVTIAAPGEPVYSTVLHTGKSAYTQHSGTSMAAPVAAAAAAQLWSVDRTMRPGQVKDLLVSTAKEDVRSDGRGLYRMVDLKKAVETLLLQRGLIEEERPDGDLQKVLESILEKNEKANEEAIERMTAKLTEYLDSGRVFRYLWDGMLIWFKMWKQLFYQILRLILETYFA